MTMTEEEIVRDYRQAKTKQKQIEILAELNACDKAEIKRILTEAGEQLPRNMGRKRNECASDPSAACGGSSLSQREPQMVPESECIAVRDALPILVGAAALKVIRETLGGCGTDDWDMNSAIQRCRGVIALLEEVERRCGDEA